MLGAVAPIAWAPSITAERSTSPDLVAARITRAVELSHAWVAPPKYQAYRGQKITEAGSARHRPCWPSQMREEIGRTSPMATEVVKGTASAVRYTIDVSGGRDSVSTKHHTIFKVGDTTVMFTSGSPPIIGNGDQLAVAGRWRGRVLICEAYSNRTAMVRGNSGLWYNFLSAAFMLPVGAAAISWALLEPVVPFLPRLVLAFRLMVLACGLAFFVPGLFLLYRWVVIRRAVKLLQGG
jgi:hypothetical protein